MAKLYLIDLPIAYLAECGFSWVTLAVKSTEQQWWCEERWFALVTERNATEHSDTFQCSLDPKYNY
jgi:hypothetical protein